MKPDPISNTEGRNRLRLIRTSTIRPIIWRKLMDHFGPAKDVQTPGSCARAPRYHTPKAYLALEPDKEKARQSAAECLSPEPIAVDEIVRQCQLTAPVVRITLLELEIAGSLERLPGNRVAVL